ncbi:MAG: GtrA family protein [Firmicutes bacterium]|nr:GtrA family protein [Bacillota bacterium]
MFLKLKGFLLSQFEDREKRGQFIRYLMVGGSGFLFEYLLFTILYNLFGDSGVNIVGIFITGEIFANSVSILVAFWFSFILNRIWSFKSKSNFLKQLLYYLILFAFNMLVTNYLIHAMLVYLAISPRISKVLVMGAVVMWNFVIYRTVIYK